MKFEKILNKNGNIPILVTKNLPGEKWITILKKANCKIYIADYNNGYPLSKNDLKQLLDMENFTGVISQLSESWDKEILEYAASKGLKYISNYAVGYNNIDTNTAKKLNIKVSNTPGVLTDTTAELAVALTFSAGRRIVEMDKFTREGKFKGWLPELGMGILFEGSNIGIIGAGRIGISYMIKMAGIGANILYYSKSGKKQILHNYIEQINNARKILNKKPISCEFYENLDKMIPKCDVISIHTPLTPETENMINKNRINSMKQNAILINTARGPIIEEDALIEALKNKKIFAAGLDVFNNEPNINPELFKLENVVITPHIGSATKWTRESMAIIAALNLKGMILNYPPAEKIEPILDDLLALKNLKVIPSLIVG